MYSNQMQQLVETKRTDAEIESAILLKIPPWQIQAHGLAFVLLNKHFSTESTKSTDE